MPTCKRARDLAPQYPRTIFITCRRVLNANGKHTGIHITPDGLTHWSGKGEHDFDIEDESNE